MRPGNMASIAVTEFMPASRPSVWRQIPGWMLDPEGPVRVRPSYMPQLLPWFLRFVAASRPSKLRELEAQGAALCARALPDTGLRLSRLEIAHPQAAALRKGQRHRQPARALGIHQDPGALQVVRAVASRRKQEMPLQQGLAGAELGQNVFVLHIGYGPFPILHGPAGGRLCGLSKISPRGA